MTNKNSNTKWRLSAQCDDGEEFELATEWHQSDLPRSWVYGRMLEAYWVPRFDDMGCIPILTKLQ